MKILMLLNANYPDDIRVTKEAKALIEGGHEVSLLCVKRKAEKKHEILKGINIHRITTGNHIYIRAFWDINMALGKHPLFLTAIKKIIKKEGMEAVHVHDLPLVNTALLSRKSFPKIKVIADLHENYPEGLKIWHKWKTSPIVQIKNRIFMSFNRWYGIEKKAVLQSDRVIAVVEEMKNKLVKNHKIDAGKITVISNTEEKSFVKTEQIPDLYGMEKDFIITYCGGIGPHRGVDTAVKAFCHLKGYKNIKFKIVGFGSSSVMNYLKQLVEEHKLQDQVEILGFQPFKKFYSYMSQAAINLIPHHKNGHTENTIPHKLFQCMMAGKPLLVSDAAPLKRVVKDCKSGEIFEAGNEKDLANKILLLYDNPDLRKQYGKAGKSATLEGNLNWENTGEKLSRMYRELENG